ncbi:MAG TPA: hypothetical protein VMW67_02595 [Desulfobacteria bacterium]|nr:hypothetical protein [Desulfobacteria bacterium]
MRLPVPPEPVELKKEARRNLYSLKLTHKLPSYLWKEGGWSENFKREGCNWQCFLRFHSRVGQEVDEWIIGDISWKELINKLEDFTEGIIFRFLSSRQNRRGDIG